MPSSQLLRLSGWSAYVSAGATVVGAVTLIIFFSVGDPFGKINDVSSIVISLAGIPVLLALHKLHHDVSYAWSLGALTVGIVALLVAAVIQTLFVFGAIQYEQTTATPLAFSVFGVAIAVYGYLAWVENLLPRGLSVLGMVAGIGYGLVGLGFILGGQNHPLTYVGGLASIIAYPAWAIWMGRVLLKSS